LLSSCVAHGLDGLGATSPRTAGQPQTRDQRSTKPSPRTLRDSVAQIEASLRDRREIVDRGTELLLQENAKQRARLVPRAEGDVPEIAIGSSLNLVHYSNSMRRLSAWIRRRVPPR
jgi:hypothetical protein